MKIKLLKQCLISSILCVLFISSFVMSGCFLKGQGAEKENNNMSEGFEVIISVNGKEMTADIFKSESGEAFVQLLKKGPLTISMSDYGGFEKVGDLPQPLPRNDETITTSPGDIILYLGNKITIYYDKNTYSFTKLGKIRNASKEYLLEILGTGDAQVTFALND